MKLFKNFTMKMVKMNFILWKIAIKNNFDWKYYVLFFFLWWVYIYNLSNKKCVYIIKKHAYAYIYVRGSCLDKYISAATWSPKQKFLAPPLFGSAETSHFNQVTKLVTLTQSYKSQVTQYNL